MSIDLNALATWTYDTGTLTHVASQQPVTIDIAANPSLHLILSAAHWKNLGSKTVYSENPADWVERHIKWNRASEDPPVLQIERHIGEGDYENFTVIELEDDASYRPILEDIATVLQDGHDNTFQRSHARHLMQNVVRLFQLAGLIGGEES